MAGFTAGGSSGFGLATAQKLAEQGMSVCVVHRDRRALLKQIEPEFEKIRGTGAKFLALNTDALDAEKRHEVLDALAEAMGSDGRVRVLMHSVAFGNLKLLAPEKLKPRTVVRDLAMKLGVDEAKLKSSLDEIFDMAASIAGRTPAAVGLD